MNTATTAIDGTAKTETQQISSYEVQAQEFAQKHKISLKCTHFGYGKHFTDDKESRHIFRCMLIRKDGQSEKQYTFKFGQSIAAGNTPPTMYDVLTCLQKYEVETFENFCSEFGYDTDSRKAEKIYKAVVSEYENLLRVCGADVLEEMQGIQ